MDKWLPDDDYSYSSSPWYGGWHGSSYDSGCGDECRHLQSIARCLALVMEQHGLANFSAICTGVEGPGSSRGLSAFVSLEQCVARESEESYPLEPSMPGPFSTFTEGLSTPVSLAGYAGITLAVASFACLGLRSWPQLEKLLRSFGRRGAVSPIFREKLLTVKAGQMRVLVQSSCYLLVPVTAWSSLWGSPFGTSRGLLVALTQNFLALLCLLPQLLSPRTLDLVYVALALLVSAACSPFLPGGETVWMLLLCNLLMTLLTAVRRTSFTRVPLLLVVNGIFGLSSCSLLALRSQVFGELRFYWAGGQGLLVVLMTLAAPALELRSRSLMYQVMAFEELQELLSACQSLLRSCFDVVVELDAEGNISGTGLELGSLLLRETARQCMQGTPFASLVEGEAAQEAFAQRLAGPDTLGLAESAPITMRDTCGNPLNLEVMWFCFSRMGDRGRERRYMLGLREFADFKREHAPRTMPCENLYDSAHTAREDPTVPEAETLSSGSFLDAGAMLVVDGTHYGLPVRRVSPSFRAQVGHVRRGRELMRHLHKPKNFESWLNAAVNAAHNRTPPPRSFRVTFKMPQGRVSALAKVLRPPRASGSGSGSDDSSGGLWLDEVPLLFYNIRMDVPSAGEARTQPMMNRGTEPARTTETLDCSLEGGHLNALVESL